MKVLITGAGFENKGAEAMVRTVQSKLVERIPNIELFLWRIPERECESALKRGLNPVLLTCDHKDSILCWSRGKWVSQAIWSVREMARNAGFRRLATSLYRGETVSESCLHFLQKNVGEIDAIIDISGFAYGDAWGSHPFKRVQPLVDSCRQLAIPMIFLPQAWGSFDKPKVKDSLKKLLGYENTRFYSRGESSCRHLETVLAKQKGEIPAYPDIAFGFNGGTPAQGREILTKMGCSFQRPIVGVSPSLRAYERVPGEGKNNAYVQALVGLIGYCIDNFKVDVVLQANEISLQDKHKDDRYLCELIHAAVGAKDHCVTTSEMLSAEETKALIGRFDLLVSSRYHSSVFGFSEGVPGIALSVSHKYRELFAIFDAEADVQDCKGLRRDVLNNIFARAWGGRQQRRQIILNSTLRLREQVDVIFDEVAALISRDGRK